MAAHTTLPLAIRIATLVSVILGFVRLINTTNSYRRQMNIQILMKYEAVRGILHQFPLETLAARFDTTVLPVKARTYRCLR